MTALPRYLQLLWNREPAGRRGPRPGRSIGELGDAGVAIADEQGLDAVSMKSVASAIGLTTMSLYRYVDSKDELLSVMLDVAYGPPDLRFRRGAGWRERVTAWARAITDRRLAHPWIVEVPMSAPPLTPGMIAWTECGLAAFDGTPLTNQQRLSALLAVDGWGHNHVRQSIRMGLIGEIDPDSPQGAYLQIIGQLIEPERFPHLARAAPESLEDGDAEFFEEEFAYGLGLLLDGIEALVARQS